MHFLGLAGMARRIPDYPDPYFFWNKISSYGSLLSGFSFLIFIYVVARAFAYKGPAVQFADGWTHDMIVAKPFTNWKSPKSVRFSFVYNGNKYWGWK